MVNQCPESEPKGGEEGVHATSYGVSELKQSNKCPSERVTQKEVCQNKNFIGRS